MQRARETFGRFEALRQQGLVSDEDYRQQKLNRESAELTYQSAKANVAQSEANLKAIQDGLSKATLRAPIAGKVTSLKAEMGETAIPGMSNLPGAVLMIISDMSEMQAEIKVNESEVVRTKVGQTAQVNVESLPGTVFQGTVIEVATGTEGTGTDANLYKVKVLLKGSREDLDKLRPGMSARAVILTHEAKNVLRVPLQAVLEREGSLEDAQKQGLLAPATRNVVMRVQGRQGPGADGGRGHRQHPVLRAEGRPRRGRQGAHGPHPEAEGPEGQGRRHPAGAVGQRTWPRRRRRPDGHHRSRSPPPSGPSRPTSSARPSPPWASSSAWPRSSWS